MASSSVVALEIADGRVANVRIINNPEKLHANRDQTVFLAPARPPSAPLSVPADRPGSGSRGSRR
jgi:hypothetical protein